MKKHKTIKSLKRGTQILKLAAKSCDGINLTEISQQIDCSTAATYHLVQTLVSENFLQRLEGPSRYILGDAFKQLGMGADQVFVENSLPDILLGIQKQLPESSVYFSEARGLLLMVTSEVDTNKPGIYRDNMTSTHPPFLSLASMIFYAFWPEERREAYENEYSFNMYEHDYWDNIEQWKEIMPQIRKKRHVFFPYRKNKSIRIAFPLWRADGSLQGAITIQGPELKNHEEKKYYKNNFIRIATEYGFDKCVKE